MRSVSIIIPTYNESKNLPPLVEEIFEHLDAKEFDAELIIVDDNSPDGTGQVAEELSKKFPIQVIHRSGKLGLGSAVRAGFAKSTRPIIGVMDADLSHDPKILASLIRSLDTHDIASGSRFAKGSEVQKWIWWRKILSQVGVIVTKLLTGVKDPLSGYFFLKRSVLSGVTLTTTGYKILFEILVKGRHQSVVELPFQFRMRKYSTSKLNWKEHWLFLRQVVSYGLYSLFKNFYVSVRNHTGFWLVMAISAGLLVFNSSGRTFWMDETAVLEYLHLSPWQFLVDYFKRPDNHPPIYYLFVLLTSKILPWNELTIRLVSILAALGVVATTYIFSLRLWAEKKTAALAALLVAVSAYFVLIGQMARYHSLTAFFNLIGLYFFYKLTQVAWTKKDAVWFVIMSILVCLTDYPHFIYTVCLTNVYMLYRLVRGTLPTTVKTWVLTQVCIMASFLPMIWLLFHRIFIQGDGGFDKQNLLANSALSIVVAVAFHIYAFFFSENVLPWNYAYFIVGALVLVISFGGVLLAWKRRQLSKTHLFIAGLFAAYIVTNTLFLNVFDPRYNFIVYPKYVFVAYPLWVLTLVGSWRYLRSVYLRAALALGCLIVAVFGLWNFYHTQNYLNASYFSTFKGFEFVRENATPDQYLMLTGDANGGVYAFYREKYFAELAAVDQTATSTLPVGAEVWMFATGSDAPSSSVTTENLVPAGFAVMKRFDHVPLDPMLKVYKEKTLGRPSYTHKYSVFLLKKI